MENKESYFNELSLNSTSREYEILTNFKDCYKQLKSEGINVCRISSEEGKILIDFLTSIPGVSPRNVTNFIYSFLHNPYETTNDTDEEETTLLSSSYNDGKNFVDAYGLSWAYAKDSIALSLSSSPEWNFPELKLVVHDKIEKVRNVSKKEHFDFHKDWFLKEKEIVLLETNIQPEQKNSKFRHDHGLDVLEDFWLKIRKSPYIEKCINSIDFNSKETSFIKETTEDGKVYIRLTWTAKGYGLVVQTTGRNKIETDKIAEILNSEYGKK